MIAHSMQGVDDIFAEFGNTAGAYGFVPPEAPAAPATPALRLHRSLLLDMHDAAAAARAEDEAQERPEPGRGAKPAPKAKPKAKAAEDSTMLYAIGGVVVAGAVAAFILLRK